MFPTLHNLILVFRVSTRMDRIWSLFTRKTPNELHDFSVRLYSLSLASNSCIVDRPSWQVKIWVLSKKIPTLSSRWVGINRIWKHKYYLKLTLNGRTWGWLIMKTWIKLFSCLFHWIKKWLPHYVSPLLFEPTAS